MDVTVLPTGPWDKPLNEYISFKKVAVLIHDIVADEIKYEFIIDYGNAEHRKWLGKLTWYAISNRMSVETLSIEEWNRMK